MCLADVAGAVGRARERAGETGFADLGSRSMPLSETPCVYGSRPVRIDAREGWQTRFGVMQAEKRAFARHAIEVRRSPCGPRNRSSRRAAGPR